MGLLSITCLQTQHFGSKTLSKAKMHSFLLIVHASPSFTDFLTYTSFSISFLVKTLSSITYKIRFSCLNRVARKMEICGFLPVENEDK